MSTATIPFAPATQGATAGSSSSAQDRQPWSPTDRDRLIFQWVKFEGETQAWVADQFDISQSTVSRIIERYERWIARGGPAQQGALTHEERLRTQRWLTYERNECLLASALRLAGEMERALDTSKSTISRPQSHPSRETEVRTEHRTIDRSGLAARYLRLAYRINMEQLKLVEQAPLPPLPLEECRDDGVGLLTMDDGVGLLTMDDESLTEPQGSQSSDLPEDDVPFKLPLCASVPLCENPPPAPNTDNHKPQPVSIIELSPDSSPMHTLHNPDAPESNLTNHPSTTSAQSSSSKNPPDHAYAVASHPPELTTAETSSPLAPSPYP